MMLSRFSRVCLRGKRRSVILFALGVLWGHFAHLFISSLLARSLCSLSRVSQADEEGDTAAPSKELMFIGVMTSRGYLNTRAAAVYGSWGKSLNGSLMFFVGQGEHVEAQNLPVHVLENVTDNVYPPQRKSFAMLEFIHREYGRRYEWFLRVDDDVFVDVRRLRMLLSSLNSSVPLNIGHPGLGRPHEVGRLGLPAGVPFCMGGPGIVFSSVLLATVADKLMTCSQNPATLHEDTEIARCVYQTTGLSCQQNGKVYYRFKNNYDDTSGVWLRNAIRSSYPYVTFHPVKDTRFMYEGAVQANVQRVIEHQEKVRQLKAMISCMEFYEPRSAEVTCKDGNCDRKETSGCHSEIHGTSDALLKHFPNTSWFLIHRDNVHTSLRFDLMKSAKLGGVMEGVKRALGHLHASIRTKQGHGTVLEKRSSLPASGNARRVQKPVRGEKNRQSDAQETFYRRVIPAVGVEYTAFVGDASSRVRPYIIRQRFDDLTLVNKTLD